MYNNQYSNPNMQSNQGMQNQQLTVLDVNNEIQRLWFEHIIWTKLAITSMANNSPDTEMVTERLLQNAEDFNHLFTAFYGPEIGAKFGNLIKEHLVIAADLVNAAKKNDTNAMAMIEKKWYQNADDIAKLMSSINPYWNYEEVKQMMFHHLALVKQETVDILTHNYPEMIKIFDQMEAQALEMADIFFEGLVRQFYSNQSNQRLYM